MSIDTSVINNEIIISIIGRFDFRLHKEFRKVFEQIEEPIKSVIFDFKKTEYLDSSALGMLLMVKEKLNGGKQNISIINVNLEIKNILDISNFGRLFNIA